MTGPGGPADPQSRHHQGDDDERDTRGQRQTLRREGADTVVELGGPIGQLLLARRELEHALVEQACAVSELTGAPGQLVDAGPQLGAARVEGGPTFGQPTAVRGELPDAVVELPGSGRQLTDTVGEVAGART